MNRKKLIAIVLVLVLAFAITGCGSGQGGNNSGGSGGSGGSEALDIESFKTIGEVMALDSEDNQWGASEGEFVYAFSIGDQYYRFKANMTAEEEEAFFNVDYSDDDYEEQQNAILAPLEIVDRQNMTDQILSQEELDKLAGKTGKELFDEGWHEGYGYNTEDLEFWLDYGPFCYAVQFEGELNGSPDDIIDVGEAIQNLVVKSASFMSMGNATDWE